MGQCHCRRFGSAVDVPHLHLTLSTDDALRPFFYADRAPLNDLSEWHLRRFKPCSRPFTPACGWA